MERRLPNNRREAPPLLITGRRRLSAPSSVSFDSLGNGSDLGGGCEADVALGWCF